jgi:hypothetical protein
MSSHVGKSHAELVDRHDNTAPPVSISIPVQKYMHNPWIMSGGPSRMSQRQHQMSKLNRVYAASSKSNNGALLLSAMDSVLFRASLARARAMPRNEQRRPNLKRTKRSLKCETTVRSASKPTVVPGVDWLMSEPPGRQGRGSPQAMDQPSRNRLGGTLGWMLHIFDGWCGSAGPRRSPSRSAPGLEMGEICPLRDKNATCSEVVQVERHCRHCRQARCLVIPRILALPDFDSSLPLPACVDG